VCAALRAEPSVPRAGTGGFEPQARGAGLLEEGARGASARTGGGR